MSYSSPHDSVLRCFPAGEESIGSPPVIPGARDLNFVVLPPFTLSPSTLGSLSPPPPPALLMPMMVRPHGREATSFFFASKQHRPDPPSHFSIARLRSLPLRGRDVARLSQ